VSEPVQAVHDGALRYSRAGLPRLARGVDFVDWVDFVDGGRGKGGGSGAESAGRGYSTARRWRPPVHTVHAVHKVHSVHHDAPTSRGAAGVFAAPPTGATSGLRPRLADSPSRGE